MQYIRNSICSRPSHVLRKADAMVEFDVFWAVPILFLVMTFLLCGVAVALKESKAPYAWWCLAPLMLIILMHWFNVENTTSLRTIFHPEDVHIGYYSALHLYGNTIHLVFNYVLLGIDALLFFGALMVCIFGAPVANKKEQSQ